MDFTLNLKPISVSEFDVNTIHKYDGKWTKVCNNFPISFDIETTSTYDENQHKIAFMYIWMF